MTILEFIIYENHLWRLFWAKEGTDILIPIVSKSQPLHGWGGRICTVKFSEARPGTLPLHYTKLTKIPEQLAFLPLLCYHIKTNCSYWAKAAFFKRSKKRGDQSASSKGYGRAAEIQHKMDITIEWSAFSRSFIVTSLMPHLRFVRLMLHSASTRSHKSWYLTLISFSWAVQASDWKTGVHALCNSWDFRVL